MEISEETIDAVMAQTMLVFISRTKAGTRAYKAVTILDGQLTDCTKILAIMCGFTYSEKNETFSIRGTNFNARAHVAERLNVPQRNIK